MLPLSMYHKDRAAQNSALSPQSIILNLYTGMYVCTAVYSSFCFLHWLSSLGPLHVSPPPKLHPCCRSERATIASKQTAQHRAISSTQGALGNTKSLVAPKIMGLFFLPPSHVVVFFLARPSRSGAPCTIIPSRRTHSWHRCNILIKYQKLTHTINITTICFMHTEFHTCLVSSPSMRAIQFPCAEHD